MYKSLLLLILSVMLASCSLVHKIDIEQGNIITSDAVKRLHPGMTKAQVEEIMGTPTLINTFNDTRINYVYTFTPGGGKMKEKQVILIFSRKGKLKEIIERNYGYRDFVGRW